MTEKQWRASVVHLLVTMLLLLALIIGGIVTAKRTSDNAKRISQEAVRIGRVNTADIKARVVSEIRQCERTQQQRTDDNDTAFRQRQVVELLTHTLLNPGILAVLPPRDRRARVADARKLAAEGKSILYEPPTNCERAVKDPHYKRPEPIPFPAQYEPTG